MKRGRLPLTALRSFEAAGRLQSFTLAAEELFISQAAISRQVRELEARLGLALFERRHRSVHLTTAGESLLRVLTQAFDDVGACLDQLQASKQPSFETVIVSSEPSFAAGWLAQRLSNFRQAQPHVDLVLEADSRLVEFRAGNATIAIRHSAASSQWLRVESRHLADVTMVAVVAPALIQRGTPLKTPSDLLRYPLLHEENRDLWQRWFEAAGVEADIRRGTVYSDGGFVLQAVLRGEGAGLMDEIFIRDELKTRRLIQPFETLISHGAYWLVARKFAGLSEGAVSFADWLGAELTGAGS
ncbi:LysR substrate-binding domain-containing protein [Rhizobium puerariae]|uniref:LysR substrate-binding domain-containing protein n=1 Tax=Rhizobium puerariae TaxID=1585791 RepID=A0ABV6AFR0_9HYPH